MDDYAKYELSYCTKISVYGSSIVHQNGRSKTFFLYVVHNHKDTKSCVLHMFLVHKQCYRCSCVTVISYITGIFEGQVSNSPKYVIYEVYFGGHATRTKGLKEIPLVLRILLFSQHILLIPNQTSKNSPV